MKTFAQAEPRRRSRVAAARSPGQSEARVLARLSPDRPESATQAALGEALNGGPQVRFQSQLGRTINGGPRAAAQARFASALSSRRAAPPASPAVQRHESEEKTDETLSSETREPAAAELAAAAETPRPEPSGRLSSASAPPVQANPPLQGVFPYYWGGTYYADNPAPWVRWEQVGGIYYPDFQLQWLQTPSGWYAIPPPPQPSYTMTPQSSASPSYGSTPSYSGYSTTPVPQRGVQTPTPQSLPPSGRGQTQKPPTAPLTQPPPPQTGRITNAPPRKTEEVKPQLPLRQPSSRPRLREGTLVKKEDDKWYVRPKSMLEQVDLIEVTDKILLPTGAENGKTIWFRAEGSRLLEITDLVTVKASEGQTLSKLIGTNGLVAISRIDAPQTPRIIFQAGYMSGDRYGMAAALTLDRDLGVLILAQTGGDSKADELLSFYRAMIPAEQIGECYCGDTQGLYRMLNDDLTSRPKLLEMGSSTAESSSGVTGTRLVARAFPSSAELLPLGTGTRLVAGAFKKNEAKAHQTIRTGWLGNEERIAEGNVAIRNWLAKTIGMPPGRYALLWAKTGRPTDEKSYHYTDPDAWMQLIAQTREQTDRIPVLIGEPLEGVETTPSLVQFWKKNFPGKERIDQQRLFNFFATSEDYDVVNVGMKSGATEGPALMGLPTIYLEEAHNIQTGRMEQWLEAMPRFMRVILDAPPGSMQKESLAKIYTGEFVKQAQGRLGSEEGGKFPAFMAARKEQLLSKVGAKGLSEGEQWAIINLLITNPREWHNLKGNVFATVKSDKERYAVRNPSWESVFRGPTGGGEQFGEASSSISFGGWEPTNPQYGGSQAEREELDYEAQMVSLAKEISFMDAVGPSGLLQYAKVTNASEWGNNCLIFSVAGALGKKVSGTEVSTIRSKVESSVVEGGYLSSTAIPTILSELGAAGVQAFVISTSGENEGGWFAAESFGAGEGKIYLVNAHNIHFGWATPRSNYNVVESDKQENTGLQFIAKPG